MMPLFLFDSPPISDLQRDHALRLAARRFPEIAVEHRFGEQDGGGLDLWVCRASNEDQLTRWAVAAELTLGEVRRVYPLEINDQGTTQP